MPDYTLEAKPALGGFHLAIDTTELAEVRGKALVSVAVPLGGEAAFAKAVEAAYGITPPAVGKTTAARDGITLIGLQRDQVFALLNHPGDNAVQTVADRLGTAAYYTDQSDSWVMLRLRGSKAREALERICMLDLDDGVFQTGDAARTMMEHLGAVILREGPDSFLLMSASSSAKSFLHAVETSLRYVS